MFEGIVDVAEFLKAYSSRDIVKLVKWVERRYREMVVPLVKGNKVLGLLELPAGQKTGQIIGQYFVDKYEECSHEEKKVWKASRWLHHGALGELLADRGDKKHKPFIVGLRRGLMMTDIQDRDEWHTPEYYLAKKKLERMR